jgi:hypothetical protein
MLRTAVGVGEDDEMKEKRLELRTIIVYREEK